MKLLSFVTLSFVLMFIVGTARSQTCESIFNTSVLSRFTTEDQETLTTLARRQVELSINLSISKVQKDAATQHLAEQLENFIIESRLTTQEEQTLKQEYRALVFQFKRELSREIETKIRQNTQKQTELQKQIEEQKRYIILDELLRKYSAKDPTELLHDILAANLFTEQALNEFKFALTFEPDVNAPNKNFDTLIHITLSERGDPFFELLIKNPKLNINIKHISGLTVFERSLNYNQKNQEANISKAKQISSHPSFDPNLIGKDGLSFFQSAIAGFLSPRRPEIAYILASHPKFDIFSKDSSGRIPLHLSYATPELIKLLISKGADVNARDDNGNTPLHFTTHRESTLQSLELLINGGADINAKGNHDRTALHIAVSNKNIKAIELLLNAKGIDVNTRDVNGKTPLDLTYDQTIIKLLESHGAVK